MSRLPRSSPDFARMHLPARHLEGDELWWDGFGLPTADGYITSAIRFRGDLVVAGFFTRIGDVRTNNIARWTGTTWEPLGQGIEIGSVSSLAIHEDDLIVGGWFAFAGGVPVRSIARWNGTNWSTFGEGIHDELLNPVEVRAVASYRDTLVVAAQVETYPDPQPARVAYWNGADWIWFGSGSGFITSLTEFDDQLYVGGSFVTMGGVDAAGVARWDGASWSDVGGGLARVNLTSPFVFALHVFENRLMVGGVFELAGGMPARNIAAWDGAGWTPAGSGQLGGVTAMSTKNDTLYTGTGNGIGRWNGVDWDSPAPPLFGSPISLIPEGDDLIVLGSIHATNFGSSEPAAAQMARLSSDVWYPFNALTDRMHGIAGGGGVGTFVGSMIPYRGNLVVSGEVMLAGNPPGWTRLNRLAEWDGNAWSAFPEPPDVSSIGWLATKADTIYAGGSYYTDVGDSSRVSVYRFDGSQWSPLPGLAFITYGIALYGGVIHEAGNPWYPPTSEAWIRRWTGSEWEVVGRALSGGSLARIEAMVEHQGSLVIAGRFEWIDGVPAENIAAWDGVSWRALGSELSSPSIYSNGIYALAVKDGYLLAAGPAVREGPLMSSVARWTGSAWQSFGPDIGGVGVLGSVGGELFASGNLFDGGNPTNVHTVARWNGSGWDRLGSGLDRPALTFAAVGNKVYMGGTFSEAGGKASFAIARWDGIHPAPAHSSFQAGRPNPFRSSTAFSYSVSARGTVRITVHDVRGREIRLLEELDRAPGIYGVSWDGRDNRGRPMPSGVYFVRASMPGEEQTKKAVLIR